MSTRRILIDISLPDLLSNFALCSILKKNFTDPLSASTPRKFQVSLEEGLIMSSKEKNRSMMAEYLGFIFKSPVTTWWGAVTFCLEVIAFLFLGQTIILNRVGILILLFIVSFSLFVSCMVVFRGWSLYSRAYDKILVTEIIRVENEQFFMLECHQAYKIGSMFEIYRKLESVEIPIGFIEITHERADGIIQAKPIWILPVHLRDIERHELSIESLIVYPTFSSSTLPRWINDQAERKIQELLRKGSE